MNPSNPPTFAEFFEAATGNPPYSWQIRLVEDPQCNSRLIDIPTGLGKTAGADLLGHAVLVFPIPVGMNRHDQSTGATVISRPPRGGAD